MTSGPSDVVEETAGGAGGGLGGGCAAGVVDDKTAEEGDETTDEEGLAGASGNFEEGLGGVASDEAGLGASMIEDDGCVEAEDWTV